MSDAAAWELAPGIVAPLLASGALYARGTWVLWRGAPRDGARGGGARGGGARDDRACDHGAAGGGAHDGGARGARRRRGIRPWEAVAFATGWFVLALALVSPLHEESERLFAAHMIQHELLMVVGAPLVVLGRPVVAMLWALPPRARRWCGRVARRGAWRGAWRHLTEPWHAWLLHGAAIWLWHAPRLFQATLTSDAVHAAQHASFVGSALLFWWTLIHARRRGMSDATAVLYLFTTAVHTGALGALLTFSRTLWYPAYASAGGGWGLTPLEDQQLAGLIMWIPAAVSYMIAALALLARALRRSEWRVASGQAATVGLEVVR